MPSDLWYFDSDKLDAACAEYVACGPSATRNLRQEEVDGAKAFLGSVAAHKLRVQPSPPRATAGLRPQPMPRPDAEDVLDG